VALKVINETKPDQESYVRFVREVTTLQDLGPQPGVLTMLDSHLPENPSKRDRAWLAMPIATPIDKALNGRPLQDWSPPSERSLRRWPDSSGNMASVTETSSRGICTSTRTPGS
jgi:hypothetical protein